MGRTFASHRYDFNDDTGVLVLDICSALLARSGAPVMRQEQRALLPQCSGQQWEKVPSRGAHFAMNDHRGRGNSAAIYGSLACLAFGFCFACSHRPGLLRE